MTRSYPGSHLVASRPISSVMTKPLRLRYAISLFVRRKLIQREKNGTPDGRPRDISSIMVFARKSPNRWAIQHVREWILFRRWRP